MKIQPIQTQPSFQMKYQQRVINYSKCSKKVVDNIQLDNGKELILSKEYCENKLMNKLSYLKDEIGEWVKSKLTFYNGKGKRSFVRTSEKVEDYLNENKN